MLIVQEHSSPKYSPRTYYNAKRAHLTLAIAADLNTAGERCTKNAAGDNYISFKYTHALDPIQAARELWLFCNKPPYKGVYLALNIAGNGIYTFKKHGVTQHQLNSFLIQMLGVFHNHRKISKIYSGGQTGMDMAGAVCASYLNIPAEITLPKGYIQRYEDGIDVPKSKQFIIDSIEEQVKYYEENYYNLGR